MKRLKTNTCHYLISEIKEKIRKKNPITFIQLNNEIEFNDKKLVPKTEQTLSALIEKASQNELTLEFFQLATLELSK